MRAIVAAAERLARCGRAVAVVGERGAGKELFARHVHAVAGRTEERFVRVDCAEVVPDRLEHELFERDGGWRRAAGGTLLLDDLLLLPIGLQQRLCAELRAGGGAREEWAPQIVASLDQEVALVRRAGRLDAGLLDQLSPVEIALPALRQRRSDIPILVQHFLALYAARHEVPLRGIETDALVSLWQYDWPGNVRELESVIERVVVLCPRRVIRGADLPAHVRSGIGARIADPIAAPAFDGPRLRPTL